MYGSAPKSLGIIDLQPEEYQYIVYLPIKLPQSSIRVPSNIEWIRPIIGNSVMDYGEIKSQYIYATIKHVFVSGFSGNRPGWHCDGFMTDDINYSWVSSDPTEFCVQEFNLTPDHDLSLGEMEEQAKAVNIKTHQSKDLLRLDQFSVHRLPYCTAGIRTFVRLSFSKEKYNLIGNAHNNLFDYNWEMVDRLEERNHTSKG